MNPYAVQSLRSRFIRSSESGNGRKLSTMLHDGSSRWGYFNLTLPATSHDYETDAKGGLKSSVLAGPLNWIMRNFPEAPPIIEKRDGTDWLEDGGHALLQMLRRPNEFYSGRTLWMATVLDLCWGNAYWLKIRNGAGKVIQLWWAPRATMKPVWPEGTNTKTYINHYKYWPKGENAGDATEMPVNDVVHFRFGLDPDNTRLGLSPLGALWREVATDDEAANFTASILRKLGVMGVVIAPKNEGDVASDEEVKKVKQYILDSFTGDKRGEPLVLGKPTDVHLLNYNMQGWDIGPLRDISEERVCAALGIPAAVVGFGTGLQQTKVGATMKENRQQAWTEGIMPLEDIVADEVDRSLLPDFEADYANYRMRFDTTRVRSLWENVNERHDRIRKDVLAGILTVAEGQRLMGYTVDTDRDVYLQPMNLLQLSDGSTLPIPPPDGGTNSTGGEE